MAGTDSLPPRWGKGRGWGWTLDPADEAGRRLPRLASRRRGSTPAPGLSPIRQRERRARSIGVLLAVVTSLFALPALAAPKFPELTGRVVDAARVLDAGTTREITARSEALEQATGRQLVVATVPSLEGLDVQDYGYQLGRAWQVGRKGLNDGVVLVVAPNERKVGIEVGYGLEGTLTDALSSVILQQRVLPRFRSGDINGGVRDGAAAIADQLALPDDQARAANAQAAEQRAERRGPSRSRGVPGFVAAIIVFAVLGSLFGGRRGGAGSWLPWVILGALSGSGRGGRDGWGGGGGGWGGGGGGGFSGGGGSFGGGGASGSW